MSESVGIPSKIYFLQRIKITFMYCLPPILACAIIFYSYHSRIVDIEKNISVKCEIQNNGECLFVRDERCDIYVENNFKYPRRSASHAEFIDSAVDVEADNIDKGSNPIVRDICQFRENYKKGMGIVERFTDVGVESGSTVGESIESSEKKHKTFELGYECENGAKGVECYVEMYNGSVKQVIRSIYLYNVIAVAVLVMLPFLLMGDLLAKSTRINLSYALRSERSNANWWIKFIVALIMAIGLLYLINPNGRGASTYYQFFITVGLGKEATLPIYIQSGSMAPVLAGFFGWYLHMIGFIFTKLIHHDVISARVYSLLFKKFIVTYGIALVVPESGLLEDKTNAAVLMFTIGLFPLTAISMLIAYVTKFTSGKESDGDLSILPGISRWQIMRLEEEGVDSIAALANMRPTTITENLKVIEQLTHFWVDIAQLYTVVGGTAYSEMKPYCLTASEFIRKAEDPEFIEKITGLQSVSEAPEIARLLRSTFAGKIPALEGQS